jgi:hypothetical protein
VTVMVKEIPVHFTNIFHQYSILICTWMRTPDSGPPICLPQIKCLASIAEGKFMRTTPRSSTAALNSRPHTKDLCGSSDGAIWNLARNPARATALSVSRQLDSEDRALDDCHNHPAHRPACVRAALGHKTVRLIPMTITPAKRRQCLLLPHPSCQRRRRHL